MSPINPGDAEIVRAHLELVETGDFSITHVQRLVDGLKCMDKVLPDVVLLDLNLPDSSGLTTFMDLRARFPEPPVIVLSGLNDHKVSVMAVREGAQDYLVKGSFNGESLARSIAYARERQRMHREVLAAALTDELTGLYNRRGFTVLSQQLLKSAHRLVKGVFLIFVDLDGMKFVNDTLGHDVGDDLLRTTAGLLRASFRESDILARLGGDEFAIFGLEMSQDEARQAVARLRQKESDFNVNSQPSLTLSLSIGLAHKSPATDVSLDRLLVEADNAMYAEKQTKKSPRSTVTRGNRS